ncbi:MAG: MBL fold metallo-hydrolase [Myxococcales bacterium]|nr:MBL fold metallo-hydrolase [Myxococcales bacterium]
MPPSLVNDDPHKREQRLLERIKELDLAHRNRLRATGVGQALSLRYLRQLAQRLVTPPKTVRAGRVDAPAPGEMSLAPVGHACVQIVTSRARVLTDPLLTEFVFGLRRAIMPALTGPDRDDVTCILLSHGHRDHLHPPSLRRLPKTSLVVAPPGFETTLARLGFPQVVTLAPEESCQHGDLTLTAVAARHEGGGRGAGANGYVVQGPEVAVFFAGDTGYFSGFQEIGRRFRPDAVLLPIGGYAPLPLRATHMSPLDAAYALEDLQARLLVPIAFGVLPLGYEPLDEPPRWLRAACEARGLTERLALLAPGERVTLRRPT